MPAIIKQSKLRTGSFEFGAESASDDDHYMCRVDSRITKVQMGELFIAVPGNPIPQGAIKQAGTRYLICDRISCTPEANQGYLWHVTVHWKELDSDEPENQDRPKPNNNSTNPDDWTPTWSRRTQTIFEPAFEAYYRGGYPAGTAHTHLNGFSPGKAPIVNSALMPFADPPESRRRIQVWNIRWLRASVPSTLLAAEGKANSINFSIATPVAATWNLETALISSVDLSKRRWGTVNLVEISVEIIVDPLGLEWRIQDRGTAVRAMVGDPDGQGGTISGPLPPGATKYRHIKDNADKAIQYPVFLDGDGQQLEPDGDPVISRWFDFETVDFNTVALLKDF